MENAPLRFAQCVPCPHRQFVDGEKPKCAGPRLSALTMAEWRGHIRAIMAYDKISARVMAERSGGQVPEKTIQTALSPGAAGGINRETARIIENTIYDADGAAPCYLAHIDREMDSGPSLLAKDQEIDHLIMLNAKTHETYEVELSTVRAEAQARAEAYETDVAEWRELVSHLRQQLERKDDYIDRLARKAGI